MLQEQEECEKEKEKEEKRKRNEGKLYAHEVCYGTGQCDKEALKRSQVDGGVALFGEHNSG